MSKNCCSSSDPVMILACSGGSNVGQLTNQAAVELTREGFGKMYCLAGLGAGLKGFAKGASEAPRLVVLDGCPVGCAKHILQNSGVTPRGYVILTEDLGIEKVKDQALAMSPEDLGKVKDAAKRAAAGSPVLGADFPMDSSGGCGCSGG